MKQFKVTIASAIVAVFFVACGSNTDQSSGSTTAEDTVATEEKAATEENTEVGTPETVVVENLNIQPGQAGPFAINAAFPGEGEYLGYTLVAKEETRETEEGPETTTRFHAMKDNETHIIIIPVHDNEALIGELQVVSPKYATSEGVSVGTSIEDFYSKHADAKAFYTYVSNFYWLETGVSGSAQYKLSGDDYKGEVEFDGDLTVLDKDNFNAGSTIQKIRIF